MPRLGLTSLCGVVCAAALFCLAVLLPLERDGVRRFKLDLFIGISFGCAASPAATTEAPPRLLSRRGRIPECAYRPGTGHTSALFARKSQSFLDNVIAGFRPARSSGDPTFVTSRIHRRDSDHSGKRTCARIMARGRAACDLQPAVSAPSRYHGGPNPSLGACGLFGIRRASPMAASPGHLVRVSFFVPMSAIGPKRTSLVAPRVSAFGSKADIVIANANRIATEQ